MTELIKLTYLKALSFRPAYAAEVDGAASYTVISDIHSSAVKSIGYLCLRES